MVSAGARVDFHEMGVVDNGSDHFTQVVEPKGFFDQSLFAFEHVSEELDAEGLAQDTQDIAVGVERSRDDGRDQPFWVMGGEGLPDGGFARSRLPEEET